MNEKNNVNNEEPINTQPEDNGVKAEKLFTQEEVNRIVSERLAKERNKTEEPKKIEEAQREAELTARENKLACKEFLIENGYPSTLLDCLDTSDTEKFKKNAISIYDSILNSQHTMTKPTPVSTDEGAPMISVPITESMKRRVTPSFCESSGVSSIGEAFSASAKHKPKKY